MKDKLRRRKMLKSLNNLENKNSGIKFKNHMSEQISFLRSLFKRREDKGYQKKEEGGTYFARDKEEGKGISCANIQSPT